METALVTTTPGDAPSPTDLWLAATGEELTKELAVIPADMAADLVARFVPFAQQANELAAEAHGIEVTDEADTAGMAEARRLRLAMKAVRVEADKVRKAEKEYALVVGKAVDWLGRSIRERAETVEARLEASEKFAERMEAERRAALAAERTAILAPICDDLTGWDLGAMAPAAFEQLRTAMQAAHDQAERERAEQEAARVAAAEADRINRELMREENERLRVENERQRVEAAAQQAETERLAAELRAREQAEAARLAAELRAKQDAEAAAIRAAHEAERAASNADDVEKMRTLYRQIEAIQVPEVGEKYESLAEVINSRLETLLSFIAETMRAIR